MGLTKGVAGGANPASGWALGLEDVQAVVVLPGEDEEVQLKHLGPLKGSRAEQVRLERLVIG